MLEEVVAFVARHPPSHIAERVAMGPAGEADGAAQTAHPERTVLEIPEAQAPSRVLP